MQSPSPRETLGPGKGRGEESWSILKWDATPWRPREPAPSKADRVRPHRLHGDVLERTRGESCGCNIVLCCVLIGQNSPTYVALTGLRRWCHLWGMLQDLLWPQLCPWPSVPYTFPEMIAVLWLWEFGVCLVDGTLISASPGQLLKAREEALGCCLWLRGHTQLGGRVQGRLL
jgi:hypothetical protein